MQPAITVLEFANDIAPRSAKCIILNRLFCQVQKMENRTTKRIVSQVNCTLATSVYIWISKQAQAIEEERSGLCRLSRFAVTHTEVLAECVGTRMWFVISPIISSSNNMYRISFRRPLTNISRTLIN